LIVPYRHASVLQHPAGFCGQDAESHLEPLNCDLQIRMGIELLTQKTQAPMGLGNMIDHLFRGFPCGLWRVGFVGHVYILA